MKFLKPSSVRQQIKQLDVRKQRLYDADRVVQAGFKKVEEDRAIIQQRCQHPNKVGGVQYGGSTCQDCGKDFDR